MAEERSATTTPEQGDTHYETSPSILVRFPEDDVRATGDFLEGDWRILVVRNSGRRFMDVFEKRSLLLVQRASDGSSFVIKCNHRGTDEQFFRTELRVERELSGNQYLLTPCARVSSAALKDFIDIPEAVNMGFYTVCDGGDVVSFLDRMKHLHSIGVRWEGSPLDKVPLSVFATWTRQLLMSLLSLHNSGAVHNDIKPENVGIDKGSLKLMDLDLVTNIGGRCTKNMGTRGFIAPEYREPASASPAADVFSLGATLFAIETDTLLVGESRGGRYRLLHNNEWRTLLTDVRIEVADFIVRCCSYHPEARSSVEELLSHPFLRFATPIEEESEALLRFSTFVLGPDGLDMAHHFRESVVV